ANVWSRRADGGGHARSRRSVMSTAPTFVPAATIADVEPHLAVEQIIRRAIELQASDIFIFSDEDDATISVRVMGQVEPIVKVSRDQGRHLINFFKTTAGMDIAEHRR